MTSSESYASLWVTANTSAWSLSLLLLLCRPWCWVSKKDAQDIVSVTASLGSPSQGDLTFHTRNKLCNHQNALWRIDYTAVGATSAAGSVVLGLCFFCGGGTADGLKLLHPVLLSPSSAGFACMRLVDGLCPRSLMPSHRHPHNPLSSEEPTYSRCRGQGLPKTCELSHSW